MSYRYRRPFAIDNINTWPDAFIAWPEGNVQVIRDHPQKDPESRLDFVRDALGFLQGLTQVLRMPNPPHNYVMITGTRGHKNDWAFVASGVRTVGPVVICLEEILR